MSAAVVKGVNDVFDISDSQEGVMSARLICSASPTSVGSRQWLRSATTSALVGRHTQLPLSTTVPLLLTQGRP